jgi:hypothetical protein
MSDNAKVYKPVPVDIARDIANKFDKDWVIIFAGLNESGEVHTTTYAVEAEWKVKVATMAPIMLDSIDENGSNFNNLTTFEDFRLRTQAEAAEEIATLKNEIDRLNALISGEGAI